MASSSTSILSSEARALEKVTSRSHGSGGGKTPVLKVLILGNGAVGKSCIMTRFVSGHFEENSFHTIGVEFLNKEVKFNDSSYTLQIWDTAGQERFKSLRTPFYRGTDICLLVYATDDKASLEDLTLWRQEFLHYADIKNPDDFPFVVVGNKVDLGPEWQRVQKEDALKWCEYNGNLPHFYTSAKTAENINEVFEAAVQLWLRKESALDELQRLKGNTVDISRKTETRPICC